MVHQGNCFTWKTPSTPLSWNILASKGILVLWVFSTCRLQFIPLMLIGGPNMMPFVGENETHQSIFFVSANGQTMLITWEMFEQSLVSQCLFAVLILWDSSWLCLRLQKTSSHQGLPFYHLPGITFQFWELPSAKTDWWSGCWWSRQRGWTWPG